MPAVRDSWNRRISLRISARLSQRVEVPEESSTACKSGLVRGLVRRLSSGGGRSGHPVIASRDRGNGRNGGPRRECGPVRPDGSGDKTSPSGDCALVAGEQLVVRTDNTTVSASAGTPPGRGTPSRRPSRDLSPSKKSSTSSATGQQDAVASHGGGGGAGTASSSGGSGQDWRKLVGSIRRKVRRKTAQNSSSISEAALQETTNRNQDDFLKAAMRIFLVVSPPMGRVQVNVARIAI